MKDLTKGNVYKTFFLFGFPLVLSGLLSQAYNVIDTAIAGQYLGEKGLASIGSTSPLILFITSIFWGFMTGFSIYIARVFGSGDYKTIKPAVYSQIIMLAVIAIVVCSLAIIFKDALFTFLNVDKEIYSSAFEYFAVYVGGLFFITSTTFFVLIFNALGISTFPFFMSLISAVLNIVGNIVSVVVLGWGVMGIALSSVVSAFVVWVVAFFKLRRCFKELGVDKDKFKFSFEYVKKASPYVIPNTIQQPVLYLASLALSPMVNAISVSATASYSVVTRVFDVINSVYVHSAKSLANYSSQCVGHGRWDKIRKGVLAGFIQGVAFITPFILACAIFPKQICSLFFNAGTDSVAREYSYIFVGGYLPFVYLNMINNLFHALYRGVKATFHLFSTTFLGTAVRLVLSAILIVSYGMIGFFMGWVLSWAVEAIYTVFLFFLGKWYKPEKVTT